MPALNLDAGELPGETEELWRLFDVLAIACGGHAGDAASMARVIACCAAGGPRVGAHPSYPDRGGFGRRTIAIAPAALTASIAEQCAALARIAQQAGLRVEYVKPHGALYHDANRDPALAHAVLDGAVSAFGREITAIGPPSGALADTATAQGLAFAREGFADRRMRPDGSLVPRSERDALITDPATAAAQARTLAAAVDTICIHGDSPNALAIARAVRAAIPRDG